MLRLTPYRKSNNLTKSEDILDRFFDDFFSEEILGRFSGIEKKMTTCKVDVIDSGDKYIVQADLPGYSKEDVSIEYTNQHLMITAKKENIEEEANYIRRERCFGEIKRSFHVEDIDPDNIEATFENGVLEVLLKKQHLKEDSKKIIIK